VWYFIRGRREYRGPLIDDEVKRIMRIGSIVPVEDHLRETSTLA
jgi:choline transport protein